MSETDLKKYYLIAFEWDGSENMFCFFREEIDRDGETILGNILAFKNREDAQKFADEQDERCFDYRVVEFPFSDLEIQKGFKVV